MISGFNTDIEHGGTVYHIQTEDKGAPANEIMSLVYDRGTILASKRSKYDGISEKELSERLTRQHKVICAAVNSGRINELVEMTRKASKYGAPAQQTEAGLAVETVVSAPAIQRPVAQVETVVASPPVISAPPSMRTVVNMPPAIPPPTEHVSFEDLPVIDGVEIIDDVEIFPEEAVAVVSEFSGRERLSNDKLGVELLGDHKFNGGDRHTVTMLVCRGTERKVVADAQIVIKVLGSSFRPVIFHARSDANGLAKVHLLLPTFQAGRAALLVRAMSDGQEIELRRVVKPG